MRRGATLLEILVSISIVALLAALATPPLFRARLTSEQVRCQSNMRSVGTLLAAYSAEYLDALPFGPRERASIVIGVETYEWGGRPQLRAGTWSFLFPDEWPGGRWNRGLQCPMQPEYEPDAAADTAEGNPTPFFAMTECVWIDERSLRAGVSADQWAPQLRSHRASDVRWPSAKVYMFEHPGFCVGPPESELAKVARTVLQTYEERVSVLTFDGAVRRRSMAESHHPPVGLPFVLTEDGLSGRDLKD